jgi:hypothetical protein
MRIESKTIFFYIFYTDSLTLNSVAKLLRNGQPPVKNQVNRFITVRDRDRNSYAVLGRVYLHYIQISVVRFRKRKLFKK